MVDRPTLWKFLKFSLIGVVNTGVDFAVFSLLLQTGLDENVDNALGFLAGAANSYLLNRAITFRSDRRIAPAAEARRAAAFLAVSMVCVVVSTLIFIGARQLPLMSVYGAKAASTLTVLVIGFWLNKTLVFRPA